MNILLKKKYDSLFHFPNQSLHLHSMLLNCGYQTINSSDYSWNGLKRGSNPFFIFQYTISGEGILRYEDTVFRLNAGKAAILLVPHDHCYYYREGMEGPWEFIYVSCNGSELIRIARELLKRNGPEIKLSIDASPIQSLKKILGMAEKNLIKNPFTASSLAYSFIIELAELIFYKKENIDCIPQSINKAIDFMMKNFSRRISLKDIAVSAKMSKFHFSRVFKQYTGKTPVNYLKEIRMNHAVLLLQTQHLLIKETASECGFSDVSYFTKEFKKTFGTSPNKFRIRQ